MPKQDLFDLETFINLPIPFTSQLEAPHQIDLSLLLQSPATPPEDSKEVAAVTRRGQGASSGVFYRPKSSALKLEMEVFEDLSDYLPATKTMAAAKVFQSAVDELNTPVFEKAPFDYNRPTHSSELLDVLTSTEDPFNFKIKSEPLSLDNVNIEDNHMIKDDSIEFKEGEIKDITATMMPVGTSPYMGRSVNNYIVISSQGISTNSSNVFTTPIQSEYEDIYHNPSDKVTPIYNDFINEEDEYLPTVNNCSDIFFNNSSTFCLSNENSVSHTSDSTQPQYIILETAPFETPDSSLSASDFSDARSPKLTLQIDKKAKNTDVIDTPDVIETIDAFENEKGFNILNFITDEDVHTAASDLSTIDLPALSSTFISQQETSSTSGSTSRTKLVAKRRRRDEDDEDYVPPVPAKKRAVIKTFKAASKPVHYDSESESSDGDEFNVQAPARRGRPPKRNMSISSEECCGNGKYRVMRNKNNEASRKSRLKRKLKEIKQEDEASILEEKNTKLRAQVQVLTTTVENFRTNLMQILLKK